MLATFASIILALVVPAGASPAPAASSAAVAAAQPAAKPLPSVIINGVLFQAVEFDSGKALWRNLAVTVTSDHLPDWRALAVAVKNGYAQQMIDSYRSGMKFNGDIKLTFIDERNTTLDQFLWTPPSEKK